MADARFNRISREVFLSAVGAKVGPIEPWVTNRLSGILEEEEIAAGDRIYASGDAPDHFYFVRQGRIELVGAGRPAEIVDGPRSFGMLDAFVEHPRSRSAYARMPLLLMKVRVDSWLELLEDSFELASTSVRDLARSVSVLEERLWATGRRLETSAPPMLPARGSPLDSVERLAVLMHTPPLRGAGVQPLSDLALASEEMSFAAGERLFERGSPPDRVFVLIDGRVEASRENPGVSWRGGCGEMVCGVVALEERRSEWEARAVTPVRALSFGVDDWLDVMEENFEMVRATLASLAIEHERLAEEL